MTYELPPYQRAMMGYDQPGGFRSVASSYTGALLTVGTRVTTSGHTRHGRLTAGVEGVIAEIRERANPDATGVLVRWRPATPGEQLKWHRGRDLMRVGPAW